MFMEAALFAKMLSDPAITNLRKLQYKYPNADLSEFLSLLNDSFYVPLGLSDFKGDSLVYMKSLASIHPGAVKALLAPQSSSPFGLKAMEEEITASRGRLLKVVSTVLKASSLVRLVVQIREESGERPFLTKAR